jgi:oxygen-dependent protoporphyrinogen oxidase
VQHIAVIGAGLAGLSVAYQRSRAGDHVTIFEASERLGGQLYTERAGEFLIEHGAEGFVAGSDAVAALARSLGIADQILDQHVRDSCHFDGQTLTRLQPGEAGRLLGFQVGVKALGRGIQSFRSGMTELVETLEQALEGQVVWRRACPIRDLERAASRRGWLVVPAAGGEEVADRVVVATTAASAASLLGKAFGAVALDLDQSEAVSSVTVSLAYPRAAVSHALDATGFVVAEGAQREGFRACTFASSKLPGRAPAGHALLRLFFRPSPADLREFGDAEWLARAERCAHAALELRGNAERGWVSRWDRALPVFDSDHRARVAALDARLGGSGIVLAGAAFHGAGIDGAVRSSNAAVSALATQASG